MTTNTLPRASHNAASVDEKIAETHPGMRAIAGPYAVNSTLAEIATCERAACVRALKDQQKHDTKAKIIMMGKFAWVIRSSKGWISGDTERQNSRYKMDLGIKGGRMVK